MAIENTLKTDYSLERDECSIIKFKLYTGREYTLVLKNNIESRKLYIIGLITVFGAILMGRQSGQKLRSLYGNLIANNFFQNRILLNL